VIGYPLLASGDRSDLCVEIDRFVEKLAGIYSGPIYKVDERYSSVEAADIIHAHGKKVGQDKKRLDRLAAVIILQRFLDERPG
jgi:putative Holliday junction resolvase